MPSVAQICTMALTLIGDQSVSDVDTPEDNDRARACKVFYEPLRDSVLRAHPWGFAKRRVALVETTVPTFGYGHAFTLPTSPYCLRVLEVDETAPGSIAWTVEGRTLLADEAEMSILYIARITDSSQFDSLFVDALAARLAESLAMALTKQKTLIELCHALYEQKLQEARTMDGFEASTRQVYSRDLLTVR